MKHILNMDVTVVKVFLLLGAGAGLLSRADSIVMFWIKKLMQIFHFHNTFIIIILCNFIFCRSGTFIIIYFDVHLKM